MNNFVIIFFCLLSCTSPGNLNCVAYKSVPLSSKSAFSMQIPTVLLAEEDSKSENFEVNNNEYEVRRFYSKDTSSLAQIINRTGPVRKRDFIIKSLAMQQQLMKHFHYDIDHLLRL